MNMKDWIKTILLQLIIINHCLKVLTATSTFYLSFTSSGTLLKEEWAAFLDPMPDLKKFSVCHWDKPRYFNDQFNAVWNYCIRSKEMKKIDCFGFDKMLLSSTANRHMYVATYFDYRVGGEEGEPDLGYHELRADTIPYEHRKWQHYCWLYSSISGENYLYWNGILVANKTVPSRYRTLWKGSKNGTQTAFIIGQEQDEIGSGYDPGQAFMGDIAELNIWDEFIEPALIHSIARCKISSRGNVKKWEISQLNINEAALVNMVDNTLFCQPDRKLVIFPKRMSLSMAKQLCTIHGGKIFTPSTLHDTNAVIEIVKKHQKSCIDTKGTEKRNWGKLIWLGIKRIDGVWYDVKGDEAIQPINYSNWIAEYFKDDMECASLKSDGTWFYAITGTCPGHTLCTICTIENTPVFTIKGLCDMSNHDYNFYMNIDSKNEITHYEGYKNNNISRSEEDKTWGNHENTFRTQLISNIETDFPIGMLKWNVYDKICRTNTSQYLTISNCDFGKEYTCSSGQCIGIEKNCDGHVDCADGSDETNCYHIRIPQSYKQINPPSTHIYVNASIDSIQDIDTIEMVLELTQTIAFSWFDSRLEFTNLHNGTLNMINDGLESQVWTPFDQMVYENALIGKFSASEMELHIKANTPPMEMDLSDAFEDRRYDSRFNAITATQRIRGLYDCMFQLKKFPFDTQTCQFKSHLRSKNGTQLNFSVNPDSVKYVGRKMANEFEVGEVRTTSGMDGNQPFFMFTITMERDSFSYVISLFFPTWLIWLLAYLTFYIDLQNFNNRFMGSVTSLLVLASLLNSMQRNLPKTSYFKYVDLWFLWYIINSISMIAAHVVISKLHDSELSGSVPLAWTDKTIDVSEDQTSKREKANRIAKVLFPLLTIPFNIIYFIVSIS